jgi:hypothetical protein
VFSGRGEILAEICQGLIIKAADYLSISSRKETDTNLKKIQDKAQSLELERLQLKNELNV